nr:MAG TPA: hypothetical protein [Crassvirales sp.]
MKISCILSDGEMGNQQPRDSMSSRFIDYPLLWGSTFIK